MGQGATREGLWLGTQAPTRLRQSSLSPHHTQLTSAATLPTTAPTLHLPQR